MMASQVGRRNSISQLKDNPRNIRFRGKFGGVYARCGYEGVMGEWGNRLDMGCLVVGD